MTKYAMLVVTNNNLSLVNKFQIFDLKDSCERIDYTIDFNSRFLCLCWIIRNCILGSNFMAGVEEIAECGLVA